MAFEKISEYQTEEALLLNDKDLLDVSVLISEGPDIYDSRSVPYSLVKGVNILAFRKFIADPEVLAINMGQFGVGVETELTWNCEGKKVTPTYLRLAHHSGAIKKMGEIKIQIGSSPNADDILKATILAGYFVDGSYIVNFMGALPLMLSDSDIFYFKVLVGAQGDVNESNVFIHGNHEDV